MKLNNPLQIRELLICRYLFQFSIVTYLIGNSFCKTILFVYQRALIRTFYTSFLTKKITFVNSHRENTDSKGDFVLKVNKSKSVSDLV